MTGINDLVEELWRTSSYEGSFFAMCRLFKILQKCFDSLKVCFYIVSASAASSTLLI